MSTSTSASSTHESSSDASLASDSSFSEGEDAVVSDSEVAPINLKPSASAIPAAAATSAAAPKNSKATKSASPNLVAASSEEARLLKQQDAGMGEGEDADADEDEIEDVPIEDVATPKVVIKWSDTARKSIPAYFQLELSDYQVEALEKMESAPNQASILAKDMGLGKTATTLGYICNRLARHKREFGTFKGSQHLVCAPKSCVRQWMAEIRKFIAAEAGIKAKLMTADITSQDIADVVSGDINIVVTTRYRILEAFRNICNASGFTMWAKSKMTYKSSEDLTAAHRACNDWMRTASESLKNKFGIFVAANGLDAELTEKRTKGPVAWPFFPKWSTFAIDEAHEIRNCGIVNWRAAFCIRASSRLLLTGAPLHNSLSDIYSYLRFLRVPGLVASDVWFATGYASFENKDAYLDLMCKDILIWRRKKDIPNLGLVPKLNFHVLAPISNPTEEAYYSAWSAMTGKFAKAATTATKATKKDAHVKVRVAILRCRQVCGAAATLPEHVRLEGFREKDFPGIRDRKGWAGTHSSKINALIGIARDHIAKGEKFTVMSSFVGLVELVMERFAEEGLGAVKFIGTMSEAERSTAIARFRDDPNISALVCSLGAGHVGLSLGWASRCLIIDPWWNPQILLEAENRVHRYDSRKLVKITYLIMAMTIEEAIMKIAQSRLEMANLFHQTVSLRDLLRKFSVDPKLGDKRKPGPECTSVSVSGPRSEALAKDAEVLWLNRKAVTKTVCEECIYEANLKELKEKANSGGAAAAAALASGPMEEEAYAGVRKKKEAMTSNTIESIAEGLLKENPENISEDDFGVKNKRAKEQHKYEFAIQPPTPTPIPPQPVAIAAPLLPPPSLSSPAKRKDPVEDVQTLTKVKKEEGMTAASSAAGEEKKKPANLFDTPWRCRVQFPLSSVKLFMAIKGGITPPSISKNNFHGVRVNELNDYASKLGTSSEMFASIRKASKTLFEIDSELATNDGMLKNQRQVIDMSKDMWDAGVLSAMVSSATSKGKALRSAAEQELQRNLQTIGLEADSIPEFVALRHRVYDMIACNRGDENSRANFTRVFDPILPFIATTDFNDSSSSTVSALSVLPKPLRELNISPRAHLLELHATHPIVPAVFVPTKDKNIKSPLMVASTPEDRLSYIAAEQFASCVSAAYHRPIIYEAKIFLADPHIAGSRFDCGSIFFINIMDGASVSRLLVSDIAFVSNGFVPSRVKRMLMEGNALQKALDMVLAVGQRPPHILCPAWLYGAVLNSLGRVFKRLAYKCITFDDDPPLAGQMPLHLRRIFRPWWCELILV